MSTYNIRFIPKNYSYLPDDATQAKIEQLAANLGARISVSDAVLFADAGANFTAVACPFCGTDCLAWWGIKMDEAGGGEGFHSLEIRTPCCGEKTDLNSLGYTMEQGFYRVVVDMFDPVQEVDTAAVQNSLDELTGQAWRVIHNHY